MPGGTLGKPRGLVWGGSGGGDGGGGDFNDWSIVKVLITQTYSEGSKVPKVLLK